MYAYEMIYSRTLRHRNARLCSQHWKNLQDKNLMRMSSTSKRCVCCFVLLVPTPKVYRVPRVSCDLGLRRGFKSLRLDLDRPGRQPPRHQQGLYHHDVTGRLGFGLDQCVLRNTLAGSKNVWFLFPAMPL